MCRAAGWRPRSQSLARPMSPMQRRVGSRRVSAVEPRDDAEVCWSGYWGVYWHAQVGTLCKTAPDLFHLHECQSRNLHLTGPWRRNCVSKCFVLVISHRRSVLHASVQNAVGQGLRSKLQRSLLFIIGDSCPLDRNSQVDNRRGLSHDPLATPSINLLRCGDKIRHLKTGQDASYRGVRGNFVRGLFRWGNFRRGEISPPLQIPKLTLPHAQEPTVEACHSMPQHRILGYIGGGCEACRSMLQHTAAHCL